MKYLKSLGIRLKIPLTLPTADPGAKRHATNGQHVDAYIVLRAESAVAAKTTDTLDLDQPESSLMKATIPPRLLTLMVRPEKHNGSLHPVHNDLL